MSKKVFLIMTFAFIGIVCFGDILSTKDYEVAPVSIDDPTEPPTPIVLRGRLETGTGPIGVGASFDSNAVYVNFSQNFGYVSVTLHNSSSDLVFNMSINTGTQSQVTIPLSAYSSGTFYLVLSNANGIVEGDFER